MIVQCDDKEQGSALAAGGLKWADPVQSGFCQNSSFKASY